MNTIIKPTIILALVAFFSAFVLSQVSKVTEPRIDEQKKEKQRLALQTVLPGYTIEEEKKVQVQGKEFQYWKASRQTDEKTSVKGFAFIASGQGYSGEVLTMVGIDDTGKIVAISVVQQTETPGLGARSQEVATKRTIFDVVFGRDVADESSLPWFQEQFSGLNGMGKIQILKKGDWNSSMKEELLQKNAISAITGATVTSRTVKESIERGIIVLKSVETISEPATEAVR